MKKVLFILSIICLLAFSCKQPCHIEIDNPSDIKPIDREIYNSVYDIFWNYVTMNCCEVNVGYFKTGDAIKIYGKIVKKTRYFWLIDDNEYEHDNSQLYNLMSEYGCPAAPSVRVFCALISDELQGKLDSCDLTKKCYVKGDLGFITVGGDGGISGPDNCCFPIPNVCLNSINDIYFE